MVRAIEGVLDEQGNIRLIESVRLPRAQRAYVMILEKPADAGAQKAAARRELPSRNAAGAGPAPRGLGLCG
jgi:hypothetical protein